MFHRSKHRSTPAPQFKLLSDGLSKAHAYIISTQAYPTLAILRFQLSRSTPLSFAVPSNANLRHRFHGAVGAASTPSAPRPTMTVSPVVTIPKSSVSESILFESPAFYLHQVVRQWLLTELPEPALSSQLRVFACSDPLSAVIKLSTETPAELVKNILCKENVTFRRKT